MKLAIEQFTLTWQSTPNERNYSTINAMTEKFLSDNGIMVLDSFGSTPLDKPQDELCAENGLEVIAPTREALEELVEELIASLQRPIIIESYEEF